MLYRMTFAIFAIMASATLIGAPGCGTREGEQKKGGDPPPKPIVEKKEPPPGDPPASKPPKADFTLTSKDFDAEQTKDQDAFKKKYAGKWIELSGTVKEARRRYEGDYLGLVGENQVSSIICVTSVREPWKTVLPDQEVKILGRLEVGIVPMLRDSVILQKSGSGPKMITAEELAKELKGDFNKTEGKYRGKNLILTGEATKIIDRSAAFLVVLKTLEPEPVVFVQFNDWSKEIVKDIKIGQQVIAVGNFITFDPHFTDKKQSHAGIYAGGTLQKVP